MIHIWEIEKTEQIAKCPVCGVTTFVNELGACLKCDKRYEKHKGKRRLRIIDVFHVNNYRHLIIDKKFEPYDVVRELENHLIKQGERK